MEATRTRGSMMRFPRFRTRATLVRTTRSCAGRREPDHRAFVVACAQDLHAIAKGGGGSSDLGCTRDEMGAGDEQPVARHGGGCAPQWRRCCPRPEAIALRGLGNDFLNVRQGCTENAGEGAFADEQHRHIAKYRQTRLASGPSAFCRPFALGIAPLGVWLGMNVHHPCHVVNPPSADHAGQEPLVLRCTANDVRLGRPTKDIAAPSTP
jgi:hypothetical protein